MILVDSSVWIDHFRDTLGPEAVLLRELLADDRAELAVADLILFEVPCGMPNLRSELTARTAFTSVIQVEIAGTATMNDAVALYQMMRRRGVTLGAVDTFIAAWCLRHRCALLARDRDFVPIRDHAGLELVDPARFNPQA